MTVRFDKILTMFNQLPTGSDLERIGVQIGSLKSLIKDLTLIVSGEKIDNKPSAATAKASKSTNIVTAESEEDAPASENP